MWLGNWSPRFENAPVDTEVVVPGPGLRLTQKPGDESLIIDLTSDAAESQKVASLSGRVSHSVAGLLV